MGNEVLKNDENYAKLLQIIEDGKKTIAFLQSKGHSLKTLI